MRRRNNVSGVKWGGSRTKVLGRTNAQVRGFTSRMLNETESECWPCNVRVHGLREQFNFGGWGPRRVQEMERSSHEAFVEAKVVGLTGRKSRRQSEHADSC